MTRMGTSFNVQLACRRRLQRVQKGRFPCEWTSPLYCDIHEAIGVPIISKSVVLTIALCIHCITHCTANGRHRSKNIVLIMPSGWTASGGVRDNQRCKANWTYRPTGCSASDGCIGRCAGGTSVRSCETDRENG